MLRRNLLISLILAVLLAACGTQATGVVTTGTPTTDVVTTEVTTELATQAPTATPTEAPGLVLIAGSDSPAAGVQSEVEALAAASGWTVQTAAALDAAAIPAETRVIVWLGEAGQASALAGAAPQARVIAVGAQAGEPSANLSWVVADPDQQAFLAGYVTMLVTSDWRAGGLLPEQPAELGEAFLNGGRYLCGRCIPLYAPVVEFPVATTLPSGTDGGTAFAALEALNNQYTLDAIFIHPAISSDDLLNQLAGKDYVFTGLQPPPEALKDRWAATVALDIPAALRQAWPQGDTPGSVINAPLALQDVNPAFLTEGKQRLADQVIQDLQSGLISPLSVAP